VPLPRVLKPTYWGFHLLALVLLAAAIALGVWQYDAWSAHRAAEARDLTRLEPLPLADAIGPDDPFPGDKIGQPVLVSGTWVPDGTVYVSGREHDGLDGYWVVTPLAVDGADGSALEIVRGWTATPEEAPASPTGPAELVAWLQPPEGGGTPDDDPADDVLPEMRVADLIQHVDQDLYGAYGVVADEVAPGDWPVGDRATNAGTDGLVAADLEQLPEAGRFTAIRNLLYAGEWWFFGGFVVLMWWRWVQEEILGRRPEDPAGDAEPTPESTPKPTDGVESDAG